jgi:hypothetical protein
VPRLPLVFIDSRLIGFDLRIFDRTESNSFLLTRKDLFSCFNT